jgi:hypothetical protein
MNLPVTGQQVLGADLKRSEWGQPDRSKRAREGGREEI